jgi:hypothetical protein
LQNLCTLSAIADASGNIVLQNPLPGTRGNLGQNVVSMPGTWTLDTAMAKSFQAGEDLRFQVRLDALNLFNHPQPANPSLNINGNTPFGEIDEKSGSRALKVQLRIDF